MKISDVRENEILDNWGTWGVQVRYSKCTYKYKGVFFGCVFLTNSLYSDDTAYIKKDKLFHSQFAFPYVNDERFFVKNVSPPHIYRHKV